MFSTPKSYFSPYKKLEILYKSFLSDDEKYEKKEYS